MEQDVRFYGGAPGGGKSTSMQVLFDECLREAAKTVIRDEVLKIVEATNPGIRQVRLLFGLGCKVGDTLIVDRGYFKITSIQDGVATVQEITPSMLLAPKPAKNKPWYQQHDKRKWK